MSKQIVKDVVVTTILFASRYTNEQGKTDLKTGEEIRVGKQSERKLKKEFEEKGFIYLEKSEAVEKRSMELQKFYELSVPHVEQLELELDEEQEEENLETPSPF